MTKRFMIGDTWYFNVRLHDGKENGFLMTDEDHGILTIHSDAGCRTMPLISQTFTSEIEFEGTYGVCFTYDETSAFLPGTYYLKVCIYHDGDQYTIIKSDEIKVE